MTFAPVPVGDPRWQQARALDAVRIDYAWTAAQWEQPHEWDRLFTIGPEVMALLRLNPWDHSAHLLKIAVATTHEGKGKARQLWEQIEAWLRSESIGAVHLEVREDNRRAVRFYEMLAFERLRAVRGYYSDGADALMFFKALNSSI